MIAQINRDTFSCNRYVV